MMNCSITGANASGANFAPTVRSARRGSRKPCTAAPTYLGAEPMRHGLVRTTRGRLLQGRDDRVLVERLQRARVDTPRRDALFLRLLRRVERADAPAGRSHDVSHFFLTVLALPSGSARSLRHVALSPDAQAVARRRYRMSSRSTSSSPRTSSASTDRRPSPGHVYEPRSSCCACCAPATSRATLGADRHGTVSCPPDM